MPQKGAKFYICFDENASFQPKEQGRKGKCMASIFVCGDIVNYYCKSGHICSPELALVIADADYSVANFEAPIESSGKPQPKCGKHLQQRPETVAGLKEQGFDLLLLANNHIMDYGIAGLAETLRLASTLLGPVSMRRQPTNPLFGQSVRSGSA
jgi:hypothetical protein